MISVPTSTEAGRSSTPHGFRICNESQYTTVLANNRNFMLEGLADDYTSSSTEVNKLIAQHKEIEFSAKGTRLE